VRKVFSGIPEPTAVGKTQTDEFAALIAEIRGLVQSARRTAATTVNTLQIMTTFEIGRRIVEHEQQGRDRVGYGEMLMQNLADRLTDEFGRGFSKRNLGIRRLAAEGQIVSAPEGILKEPYILEFLGLDEKPRYAESDLEQAIIDRIEHFLLDLGKGFLFESRQKRFTFDEGHYFVDLVFYNRLLRCYVLIDLKIGKLSHQDLGQMQMYVNWFDREVKLPEENPTIGILLCKQKKDAIVELTLPKDANIHAREYSLYLPSKELLKQKLLEWSGEEERRA